MTMVSSGLIAIGGTGTSGGLNQSINVELGLAQNANSSLGQTNFRTLAGVATGAISMSNFYGKSNFTGKGYWPGGFTSSSSVTNVIQSINFNTEAKVTVTAVTQAAAGQYSSVFNATNAYITGGLGLVEDYYFAFRKFVFSTEVATTLGTTTNNVSQPSTISNQVTYAYLISGYGSYGPNTGRTRFTFSNETKLNQAVDSFGFGWANEAVSTSTDGYGRPSPSAVQKFAFSNETISTLSANLGSTTSCAGAQSSTVGYFFGGGGGTSQSLTVTRAFTISTGAARTVAAVLANARQSLGASQNTTKAYIGGGLLVSTMTTQISGFTFSTEAMATQSATMSPAVSTIQGFQNGGVL